MEKSFWNINKKYLILLVCLTVIPKLVVTLFSFPVVDITDEVAALSVGAFLSGDDWSNVVSRSGYYGFGYYSLFAPLLYTDLSIETIYIIINFITALLSGIIPLICYYIYENYFGLQNKWKLLLLSLLFGYLTVNPVDRILNDHIFIILIWIMTFFLCRLIEVQNNSHLKNKNTCILVVILSYSLLIHTRAITILIALVLGILCYGIKL